MYDLTVKREPKSDEASQERGMYDRKRRKADNGCAIPSVRTSEKRIGRKENNSKRRQYAEHDSEPSNRTVEVFPGQLMP